jgi:ATP-dependent Clp protease, protease subunit
MRALQMQRPHTAGARPSMARRLVPAGVGVGAPLRSRSSTARPAANWRVFGPSASYSDGDAEYFRLSSQLADQYEWFAPSGPQQQELDEDPAQLPYGDEEPQRRRPLESQQNPRRPLYGLTPQQIAALGLSGPRVDTPDPVRDGGA